jgi:hypothetical protein
MKYIIALLLCYTITIGKMYATTDLFKKVVTSGNKNATLGQVIAGYKNNNHIGIRIPKRLTTSVDEFIVDNSMIVYPNPTNQETVFFTIKDVKVVLVTDIIGNVVLNAYDFNNQMLTLPYRGVFYIKVTTNENKIYSTRVIFN